MLKSILKSWKENRGNLLLALGSVAGLMMCLVWYFQLVPEVRLMALSLPSTMVSSTGPRSAPNSLVGILRLPPRERLAKSLTPESLRAVVEVYPPHDTITEHLFSPLLVQVVTLPEGGGPVAVVFNDLPPGRYAAVAYIDLDDNGRFDLDEAKLNSEPFSLARLLGPPRQASAANDLLNETGGAIAEAPELPVGIFELETGRTTLIVFDFESADPNDSNGTTGPSASPKATKK